MEDVIMYSRTLDRKLFQIEQIVKYIFKKGYQPLKDLTPRQISFIEKKFDFEASLSRFDEHPFPKRK